MGTLHEVNGSIQSEVQRARWDAVQVPRDTFTTANVVELVASVALTRGIIVRADANTHGRKWRIIDLPHHRYEMDTFEVTGHSVS
jgi:hypothetical protein